MVAITDSIIEQIKKRVEVHLENNTDRMNEVFQEQEQKLSVSIALQFKEKKGQLLVKSRLQFNNKFVDQDTLLLDEKQKVLPGM